MKTKAVLSIGLLVFVAIALVFMVAKNTGSSTSAEAATPAPPAESTQAKSAPDAANAPEHQFIATYFHNDVRCPSCIKIEKQSREAIQAAFGEQLEDGELVYRMVNIDKPENAHYIEEYGLYTKHLIIAEQRDGKDVRWLDLPKVWDLLGDEEKFKVYVVSGIEGFMAGEPKEGDRGRERCRQRGTACRWNTPPRLAPRCGWAC